VTDICITVVICTLLICDTILRVLRLKDRS
jgi:hypothetical protein